MEVSLQAGRVVGERWRLRDRLGDGRTSRFWEAEELRTGCRVAIEFACVDLSDPQARLTFAGQTRALLAFGSPLAVRTLDRGLAGEGLAFAVTQFLQGEDLGRILARESVLGLADAAQILDQVCRGISKLNAANIRCPVLEPKYVFVVEGRGRAANARVVKLLNAGLGERAPRERRRSSAQYVSPEGSARGLELVRTMPTMPTMRTLDEGAQVWALGVLGCRMLTGALPFDADSRGTLADDWGARFTRLRETQADLPAELDEWFRTAIHPDPGRRFATVEQAGLALGHIATTYGSSVAAARLRPTMDRSSPKPPRLPTRPTRVRAEPQRVSAAAEREHRALAPTGARAALIDLDRPVGPQGAPVVHPSSGVAVDGGAAAAVEQALAARDDIHDRETLASRVHAAATKRRKKVAALERSASLGRSRGKELPLPPAASLSSPLGFVREPAPIMVREAVTLTPDGEGSLGARAAAVLATATAVVRHPSPARELAPFAGRSYSYAAERARMLRIERARWRASAMLAVIVGLFGGFALRSIVAMKVRTAELAADGAAFEEGIPARAVLAEPAAQPLAAVIEAPEPAGPVELPMTSARIESNVRPPAAPTSPLKRSPFMTASRTPPALEMPTKTPPHAVASRAALPAAPPPVDTTPLQVYRGF